MTFEQELVKLYKPLRMFGMRLTGNDHAASDDLAQETVLRALVHKKNFTPGTSMKSWTFTILRNLFLTNLRRTRIFVDDPEGAIAASASTAPAQHPHLELQDVIDSFKELTDEQAKVVWMKRVDGMTQAQIARATGIPQGTVKSTDFRGRKKLERAL